MSKKVKKIIVNSLSISRIVGAALIPACISLISVSALVPLMTFILLTDFFDGKLARKWEVQTVGGSLLDPLGDKVLALSIILSLIGYNSVLVVPLFLEFGISVLNICRELNEEKVTSSNLGKLKTWFLSLTLLLVFANAFKPEIVDSLFNLLKLDPTIKPDLISGAVNSTCCMQVATLVSYSNKVKSKEEERKIKMSELKSAKEILCRLFDETKYHEDINVPLVKLMRKEEKR